MQMPLSPEEEVLCEGLEKGKPDPRAAALIRQQAHEIDDLWDRLSRAYALVRREPPAEMIQDEMEALRAMLGERRKKEETGRVALSKKDGDREEGGEGRARGKMQDRLFYVRQHT